MQRLLQELEIARDVSEAAKRDAAHAASHAELAAKEKAALERDWQRRLDAAHTENEAKIQVRELQTCMYACTDCAYAIILATAVSLCVRVCWVCVAMCYY